MNQANCSKYLLSARKRKTFVSYNGLYFLQFIFITSSSAENIEIEFYCRINVILLMYHFEDFYHRPYHHVNVYILM